MLDRWIDAHRLPLRLTVWLAFLAAISVYGVAASAQTVTLTASPSTGISPLNATLTWSTSGFPQGATVTCTASGGWTGQKAASGTQALVALSATQTYTLTCAAPGGGTADLSWTPPTQNTDGSPLTDLAGYQVFHAATSAGVPGATPIAVQAPASSYSVTGLPTGMRYFGVKAVNAAGIASPMSGIVSKDIVASTATASVTITVQKQPQAPTLLTIATTAYELRLYSNGTLRFVQVGRVPLGAACDRPLVGDYAIFDGAVEYTKAPANGLIAARCAAG